ncbi:MAG: N-acetylneuraminate synthase family protein [Elusimicrobia bacterium]|nr:N-acetylneuraminate synthase family protein [Elusimicrobiota bacterium]
MIIERNVAKYVIFSDDSLVNALRRISENKAGFVFALTETGIVEGVLTDGDVRRWLVAQKNIDMDAPVSTVANRQFVSAPESDTADKIEERLTDRIRYVPVLDRQGRLVGVASRKAAEVRLGDFVIADDSPTFVIAEIGNNHNGRMDLALRLVDEAVAAGANCAKFQLRSMDTLYRKNGKGAGEDLGAEYTLDLLAKFQLDVDSLFKVFDHCKKKGILPLCTPWDRESLKALERYGMLGYKVASADLTNHDLMEALAATRKPLLCSTGMSSESEIVDAVRLLKSRGVPFALLHCNSTYPAPFKDINLNYLDRLHRLGDCPVGYSGHERGYSVVLAAVAKGARVVEKHFTLDRDMEGNDHRVSLLPDEFKRMVEGLREIEQSFGGSEPRKVTQGEMMNREVLAKSLVINRALRKGESITADMIEVRSPGRGLAPYRKTELVGRAARRDFTAGDFFYPTDVEAPAAEPRSYRFRRPFGIPIRYHDLNEMAGRSNFDLMEFHLSYKDLDLDPSKFLSTEGYDLNLVVHSPELFAGDHLMDLSSANADYRRRSEQELQRVIDVTRRLKPSFKKAQRPLIIINAGGFTLDAPLSVAARAPLYDRIAESLSRLDAKGVEIIPQTMPPFPWHFGGQRYHNLFMDAGDIVAFCKKHGVRVCLDVSHSKLACTHAKASFQEFLDAVGPHTAHLHIVDAQGVDGEGLQIGEGEVDFRAMGAALDRSAPGVGFIPEIWQGHKNGGAGFWTALERLENHF